MPKEELRKIVYASIEATKPMIYDDIKLHDQLHLIEDLGFESVSIIQLIAQIEEQLDITFDYDTALDDILRVDSLLDLVANKVEGKNNGIY